MKLSRCDLLLAAELITATKEVSGRNAKMDVWYKYRDQVTDFLSVVNDPDILMRTTWEKVEQYTRVGTVPVPMHKVILDATEAKVVPNKTRARLKKWLRNEKSLRPALKALCDKTLDCGVTAQALLDSFGSSAYQFKPQLATDLFSLPDSTIHKLLKNNYTATQKFDGLRCYFKCCPSVCEVFSRTGKPLHNLEHLCDIISQACAKNNTYGVFDGEILASDWNESVTAVKKKGAKVKNLTFHAFDCVPLSEVERGSFSTPYQDRYNVLKKVLGKCKGISIVKHIKVSVDPEDPITGMRELMDAQVEQGYEGIVLHDLDAPYSCTRSRNWLKLKPKFTDEFIIIDTFGGKGKYSGMLGGIIVEGVATHIPTQQEVDVECSVGSGFSDAQRKTIDDGSIGKMVEIEHEGATKDGSLRFPRFLRFRGAE